MDQRHALCDRLEVERPVERGIAAADDQKVVAAEIIHAPHGIEDALALIRLDARDRRALGLERAAAGRNDNDLGLDHLVLVGGDPERPVLEPLDAGDHAVEGELRVERRDLLHQLVDDALGRDGRPYRNVVDRLFRIEFRALAARPVENVDQMAFQVEQTEFEDGEQAHRPCAYDDDVGTCWLDHDCLLDT